MKFLLLIFIINQNANYILERLRKNQKIETSKFHAEIEIRRGNRVLFKEFKGMSRGSDFYIVFLNPEDKDVKYLKIKRDLFIYLPDIDDVVRISGDMLKQSFMGTDLSYEDLMEEDPLRYYKPESLKDTLLDEKTFYFMEIVDTTGKAPYYIIKMIIDKENVVTKKEELFTKSGRKIKEVEVLDYKKIGKRIYPVSYIMRDLRLKNSYTKVTFKQINFDIKVPDEVFTQEYLRR